MTTPGRPPSPPTEVHTARGVSIPKAAALLAVALALGVYLVQLTPSHPASLPASGGSPPAAGGTGSSSPPGGSTTSSTPPSSTTSTTAPPSGSGSGAVSPSSAVKVLVANASQTNGVAGSYTSKLASAGWGTLSPVTALTTEATSSVWYASGEKAAADAVASALGIPSSAAQSLGLGTPVPPTSGADVVVVVGDDLAAKAPSGG